MPSSAAAVGVDGPGVGMVNNDGGMMVDLGSVGSGGVDSGDVDTGAVSSRSLLVRKLRHPLEEIRIRALKTLLQKLDLGFVTVADLAAQLELVKAVLQWFNFPSSALRSETLNLLLLISKEGIGCKSLATVGAIPFLTELRMESSALESQTIDAVMQNVIMKSDATTAAGVTTNNAQFEPYVNHKDRIGEDPANPVDNSATFCKEQRESNKDEDNNNNNNAAFTAHLHSHLSNDGGGTPRGILRDVDPQLLCHSPLRTALNSSPPPLPACDAATLTSAISAINEAASAAAAVNGPLHGSADYDDDVHTTAAEAVRSTLTFVDEVVLKDFPVEYLMTTSVNEVGVAPSSFGVDLLGALIDAILVWKDKRNLKNCTSSSRPLSVLVRLLETLERFVDKWSVDVSKGTNQQFRRQFLVVDSERDDVDENGEDDSRRSDCLDASPPNPFRHRSKDSVDDLTEGACSSIVRVNVGVAASVLMETLCGVIAGILRPLDQQLYSVYNKNRLIDGIDVLGSDVDDLDDPFDDPLQLFAEDSLLLRASTIAVDVVSKVTSLLLDIGLTEFHVGDTNGNRNQNQQKEAFYDEAVNAASAVFDRCLAGLGDAVSRLSWRSGTDEDDGAMPTVSLSTRPSTPTRSQLWTYAHLGSVLSVLSSGFLRFMSSLTEKVFSSTSSSSALPPPLRRLRRLDPHDLLPPSCVSSLHLLALDPFFHALFPNARADSLLPILSHVKPADAGKIVDALDVCAMVTETHFRLEEGNLMAQSVGSAEAPLIVGQSLASIVPYLTYTQRVDVIPNVIKYYFAQPKRFQSDIVGDDDGDSSTLVRLLAHPLPALRTRIYASIADVVVTKLESAAVETAVENPSGSSLKEELGFLVEVNKSIADSSIWREMVLYGLGDGSTSCHVERVLTAFVDHLPLDDGDFLKMLVRNQIVPYLPYLIGFAAPNHSFASTMACLLNSLKKNEEEESGDLNGRRSNETAPSQIAILKSTLALLFSRDKEWRSEGMRRFLALDATGAAFLSGASVVEVEIFADAFVKAASSVVSEAVNHGNEVKSSSSSKKSLDQVGRIFTNSSAAADVRSTAARTLANALVDHVSCDAFYYGFGEQRQDGEGPSNGLLSTCLEELRRADNVAAPPILSIDDVIPAVTQLLAKLSLSRDFRRKLSSSVWRWKCGDGTSFLSSRDLILMLIRLSLKFRKNSSVVENCAVLFSTFAFADMEKDQKEANDPHLSFAPPNYPSSILRRFSLPAASKEVSTSEIADITDLSPNYDATLINVHQRLREDKTLLLIKHCWSSLGESLHQHNDGGSQDGSMQTLPLDYSPEEAVLASLLSIDSAVESALHHLRGAACHEDVAVAVALLGFPALSERGVGPGDIGRSREGSVSTSDDRMDADEESVLDTYVSSDQQLTRYMRRFFVSSPASEDDQELFLLVLRLLKKMLQDSKLDLSSDPQTHHWFYQLIFHESFPLFLRDLLASVGSAASSSSSSSSAYATSLLKLLAHPPSDSFYSLNVMTVCINWLGSGLELSMPGVVSVVEASTKLVARTVAAKMDVITGDKDGVMREALRILCLHCCNVVRLLLARRSPHQQDTSLDPNADPSLVFGSAAIESAANDLLSSLQALCHTETEVEFGEFLASTLLSSTDASSVRLWFFTALSSPSPSLSSIFWSLMRLCCSSSASSLALTLRQFPDFFRVCVETATDAVESSPVIVKRVLQCLLLSAHSSTRWVSQSSRASDDVVGIEASLRKLLIRYDIVEHVITSVSHSVIDSNPDDDKLRLEINISKLHLLKWFVDRRMLDASKIIALTSFLVESFVSVSIPSKNRDQSENDDDDDDNDEGHFECVPQSSLRIDYLSALVDLLLSVVSLPHNAGSHPTSPPPSIQTLIGLSSDFLNRAFGLLSLRFVRFAPLLWPSLIKLISKLVLALSSSSPSDPVVTKEGAISSLSSLYPVAIAMLENKDSLMDVFIRSSSFPSRLLSSSLLTSLYRFCALLFTPIGRDADCLEVLDGLLDIPHAADSDETHGSLLVTAVHHRFARVCSGGNQDLIQNGNAEANTNVTDDIIGDDSRFSHHPPTELETAAGSFLKALVAVSCTAKTAAIYDLGLADRLLTECLSLEAALTLDSLNGGHNADGSIPPSDGVLRRLLMRLGILTNLLMDSDEARSTTASSSGAASIGRLFHRLWSWVGVDESIADSFFRCVGAFAADNPVGVANSLCCLPNAKSTSSDSTQHLPHYHSRPSSSMSSSASFAQPPSSSYSSSIIHAMTVYVSQSRHPSHHQQQQLRRRCFVLLGQMAALSAEVRGILTKTHFLECGFCRLNPKVAVSSSPSAFSHHSSWLDFVCTLTMAADGQALVFKANGAVDLLLEYLNLSNGNISPSSLSSLSSLRQKSALALHNLCFSSKNVILFARETFLPSLIRRATQLPNRATQPAHDISSTTINVTERKTTLICCAALWALATRLKKNASLMKGSDCGAKLREVVYKMSRDGAKAETPEGDLQQLSAKHLVYCQKILAVLES